jgi:hypothetical protein
VEHDQSNTVHGKMTETIDKDTTIHITQGNLEHKVQTGTALYDVKGALTENYQDTQTTDVHGDLKITSKTTLIHLQAATDIQLQVGKSTLLMQSNGSIELSGVTIAVKGTEKVGIAGESIASVASKDHSISGALVVSEGSTSNTVKGGVVMLNP